MRSITSELKANHAWDLRWPLSTMREMRGSKRTTWPYARLTFLTSCFSIHVCDFVYKCMKFWQHMMKTYIWTNCIGQIISWAAKDRIAIIVSRCLAACQTTTQMYVRFCTLFQLCTDVNFSCPKCAPSTVHCNTTYTNALLKILPCNMIFNSTICVNFGSYLQDTPKLL